MKSAVMESDTIVHASTLWQYLSSFRSVGPADAVAVCCSYDLRVCDHACNLVKRGIANTLVLSGNTGNWTRHIWRRPEAEIFAERALENGLPSSAIVIENKATNFGENVAFTRSLLRDASTVLFVTKPAAVLRVILTAKAQWPGIGIHVSCPSVRFPYDVSNVVGVLGIIDEMVGDVERILEYPKLGYQMPHELPAHIVKSWQYLQEHGFTRHLLPKRE